MDEKIVIFDSYDTVMEANLAKTKLDAYGVPCFLTEENFTSMYPLRNNIFPGVRLHVFERDVERVRDVLDDKPATLEAIKCPRCQSSNTSIEETRKDKPWYIALALSLMIPVKGMKVYYCHDCQNEWN